MNCGCCGQAARDMENLTAKREAMYACDPCRPPALGGTRCPKRYHFFTATDQPPKYVLPEVDERSSKSPVKPTKRKR